jgi:hypothetical protein
MLKGLLMDVHVERHTRYLIRLLQKDDVWKEIWDGLHCQLLTLGDCGLDLSAPDVLIWDCCQREQFVLVTANRNSAGPDSLGETIKNRNVPTSLPVLTLANLRRIQGDPSYAWRTSIMLLQYLEDIEDVRGAGRLYVP